VVALVVLRVAFLVVGVFVVCVEAFAVVVVALFGLPFPAFTSCCSSSAFSFSSSDTSLDVVLLVAGASISDRPAVVLGILLRVVDFVSVGGGGGAAVVRRAFVVVEVLLEVGL
jgi:hypothetical protein